MSDTPISQETEIDVTKMSDEEINKAMEAPQGVTEGDTDVAPTDSVAEDGSSTTPEAKPTIEEQLRQAQERIDMFEKRLSDKDRYIGTRNEKIKELEARVQESRGKLHNETLTTDNYSQFHELVETEKELATERQALTEYENKERVSQLVPDLDELKDYMVQVGRELGDSEDTLAAFKENPYRFDPPTVARIAREARLLKRLDEVKSSKQLSDTLNSRVTQAAQATTLTNSSGSTTSPQRNISDTEIRNLTDAEIDALLGR